uniref:Alpha/beta fold hydrolase n=1 Tax=Geoglobus ahangari TaxID=113653 RepID=A0A7C4WC74_9EURY
MEVVRRDFKSLDNLVVPSFHVKARANEAAVIIHGYSSSKDEWLGFSYNIAEKGVDAVAIDLRGHGDNENPLDENVLNDVEGVIKELRNEFEKVYTIGHSLGGLLSLCSTSDFAFAISPPLTSKLLPEPKFMLRLNSCKVREKHPEVLFNILERLNPPRREGNALIFYGSGESKGIKMAVEVWSKDRNVDVVEINENQATLPEIDVDAEKLKNYLPAFISHLSIATAKEIIKKIRF